MSETQNIEALEAQVLEIKQEHKRCEARTLRNLEKLYKILNGSEKNSEEDTGQQAASAAETVPHI